MKLITIFDPTITGTNLGDHIIMDSVENSFKKLFPEDFFFRVPTHQRISKGAYNNIRKSSFRFVGGTNLLSSNMHLYNQWRVNFWDSLYIQDIILMGVGWRQYQEKPNYYTRLLLKRLLSEKYLHSVRDSYTESKLRSIGITNAINTACPTMWGLNKDHCSEIPKNKAAKVIVTFTQYNQKKNFDEQLFKVLQRNYETIYFWIQQPGDYEYMLGIAGNQVSYVNPNLESLDHVLSTEDVDYVGTRLHAGIRALQFKRRTLILSVDNRAMEISRDTHLPVCNREELDSMEKWINMLYTTDIRIPEENIQRWIQQF